MDEYCIICDKRYSNDYPYQRRRRRDDLCNACDIFNEGYIAAEEGKTLSQCEFLENSTLTQSGNKLWSAGYVTWRSMNPDVAKTREKTRQKSRIKRIAKRFGRTN